ncbi:MAG: DUF4232 domain-containing protein [Streptosporangiaceae bacterium]
MNLTHARRLAAAIAIVGTAVLLPSAALAASSGTAAPQAPAAGRCLTSELTAWIGWPGNGTAGSTFYQLEISNISGRTCTLYGYPGVSAMRNGGQIGSPADRSTSHPDSLVTLRPGATAHVILQVTDVGVYGPSVCHMEQAFSLRVYAPGDYGWHQVPLTFNACANQGPIFLRVSTTLAGTGIPGYSH